MDRQLGFLKSKFFMPGTANRGLAINDIVVDD
jgi:hypothetical protein